MDIGFYLLDIKANNNFQNEVIENINQFCIHNPYDNVVLFNNQFDRTDVDHKYYILHIQQAKYFDGILFVFDTRSAMITQTFPSPKKKIIYINEPEWNLNPNIPYDFWKDIYMQNNTEIITNNKSTYDICDICWKTPKHLMQNMSYKEFENVISKL